MYYVIEIQENEGSSPGALIFSYEKENDAESKYHAVLSAAAISNVHIHSAFMFTVDGHVIKNEYYTHEQEEPDEGQTNGSV